MSVEQSEFQGISASKTCSHVVGAVFGGKFRLWLVTFVHFLLLMIAFMALLEGFKLIRSNFVLALVPMGFGGIALFLVSAHLYFNLTRVYVFGPSYASFWSSFPPSYNREQASYGPKQRRALKAGYMGFSGRFIVLLLVLRVLDEVSSRIGPFDNSGMSEFMAFALNSLIAYVFGVLAITFAGNMGAFLAVRAVGAPNKSWLLKHPRKGSDGLSNIAAGAFIYLFIWVPETVISWMYDSNMFDVLLSTEMLAGITASFALALYLCWQWIIFSCFGASNFSQQYPDTKDYFLELGDDAKPVMQKA